MNDPNERAILEELLRRALYEARMRALRKFARNFYLAIFIVIGIIAFFVYRNYTMTTEGKLIFEDDKGFWRGEVKPSEKEGGYLLTQKLIPLRAIARRPNVPMFSNKEQGPKESFRQVMQPWKPYYVYEYDAGRKVLRIGEKARKRDEDSLWALEADVYCWTTREVLNIEKPVPIYASLEDARADKNRIKESYVFGYGDHSQNRATQSRMPVMMALPVLRREEGKFWSFIRPDPEPQTNQDRPYQVCWIRWEGQDPSASVRLRITRPEFESYIAGLQKLLYDYRYGDSEGKATAHREMRINAQTAATGEEERQHVSRFSNTQLEERTKGIPHPSGILVSSIQSELQKDNVEKRLKECVNMSSDRSLWGATEVAYVEVDRLP